MAPDLDRAWILGGFCLLTMAPCVSLMVLSEPITFNIEMSITQLIMVISLSHRHICVQHLKDYNFGVKNNLRRSETPINIILLLFYKNFYYFLIFKNMTFLCNKHLCAVDRESCNTPPPQNGPNGCAHV